MKVDEMFAAANRLWQEISVIVLIHAVVLTLAVLAQVVSPKMLTEGLLVSLTSLPTLKRMRDSLQGVGLDLPLVAGALGVVYVVLFQRLSGAVAHMPGFRLSYDQPSLWRAGKCFDELAELNRVLTDYSKSATLTDLETTLRLGVTQAAEEFPEQYRELVGGRETDAALWARYYSGFCLVALASVAVCAVMHSPGRAYLLPVGLFAAALAARCGWEAAVERMVFGRLRFALDCSVVGKKRTTAEERVADGFAEQREAAWERARWSNDQRELVRFAEEIEPLERELELAGELVQLPPPCLPFQRLWLLHGLRQIWPFKDAGAFPLTQNEMFRAWLQMRARYSVVEAARAAMQPLSADERRLRDLLGPASQGLDGLGVDRHDAAGFASHDDPAAEEFPWGGTRIPSQIHTRLSKRWCRIADPGPVRDDRTVVQLLRTRPVIILAHFLGGRLLLVDHPTRYWRGIHEEELEVRQEAISRSFRRWAAKAKRPRGRTGDDRS